MKVRVAAFITVLLLVYLGLSAAEKKRKAPEQFCTLSFVVLKDSSGKPIKNASVVIHSLREDGSQDNNEGFQLKTDANGKAFIDDIPYGKLRLQVLAHSLQTYGDDIEVKEPKQEIVIRLKPPADQISIYK
jgi:hypothetical protein